MERKKHSMNDNRYVESNRNKGIERVIQRKGDLECGQGGKMNNRPSEKANWRRPNSASTPRKA